VLATEDADASYICGLAGICVPTEQHVRCMSALVGKQFVRPTGEANSPTSVRSHNFKGATRRLKKLIGKAPEAVLAHVAGVVSMSNLDIPLRKLLTARCRKAVSASKAGRLSGIKAALTSGFSFPGLKKLDELCLVTSCPAGVKSLVISRLTGLRSTAFLMREGNNTA
jgi:hypothetical protein